MVSFYAKEDPTRKKNGATTEYGTVLQFGGYDKNLFRGFNDGEPMIFQTTHDIHGSAEWGLMLPRI